jgi:glycosyltransferase involved in cell wall biosynthesis
MQPSSGALFVTGVDYANGFARQNPLGVLRAYRSAFSSQEGHRLVVDTIHADRYPAEHALLLGAAAERPDIEVRAVDLWSPAARDRFLAGADCYVSLHRADGGLGEVAKAMAWGTCTVVTATPASLEFQTDQDSGLVRSEAVPVPDAEYRYPTGSVWYDADPDHARALLRSVVEDPGLTTLKVRRAREVAGRRFSRAAATGAIRARLSDIGPRLHPTHRGDRMRPRGAPAGAAARR